MIALSYIEDLINCTNQQTSFGGNRNHRNPQKKVYKPMKKIEIEDIGIISPYKSQCKKFTNECKKRKWDAIKVGSLEIFQGQERPVIIVSTVRSRMRSVGFLENYGVRKVYKCKLYAFLSKLKSSIYLNLIGFRD